MPGVEIAVEFPELEAIRAEFKKLKKNLAARYMGAALKKAIQPGLQKLKAITPRGPTGNLKRAIKDKVKRYTNGESGSAVALAGYVAAGSGKSKSAAGGKVRRGSDRAFHAGFVEFGTKPRRIKTVSKLRGMAIASSYDSLGPFTLKRRRLVRGERAVVNSQPKYPKAFFKAARKGESLMVGAMPKGGRTGKPPVQTAFKQASGQMRSRLNVEMTKALNNALRDKFGPLGRKGKK